MIRLPVMLVAAQWALLLGVIALVVVFYRQLAYLTHLRRVGSDAERSTIEGAVGHSFPTDVSARTYRDGALAAPRLLCAGEAPSLLLFADPQCFACNSRLDDLNRLQMAGELANVDVLAVTDASLREIGLSPSFSGAAVPIARIDTELLDRLGVETTPYFFAVASDGQVKARGVAGTASELGNAHKLLVGDSVVDLDTKPLAVLVVEPSGR